MFVKVRDKVVSAVLCVCCLQIVCVRERESAYTQLHITSTGRVTVGLRNTFHMRLITLNFLPNPDQNHKGKYCNFHRMSSDIQHPFKSYYPVKNHQFQTISSCAMNTSEALRRV